MALANPLVISYNSVSKSLAKINQDNYGSEYFLREATQSFRIKIRNSRESPTGGSATFDRHNVEVTHTIFGTGGDPDVTAVYYVVLRNTNLSTTANLQYLVAALQGVIDATMVAELQGWQS